LSKKKRKTQKKQLWSHEIFSHVKSCKTKFKHRLSHCRKTQELKVKNKHRKKNKHAFIFRF
jgi:hypothetical protein